MKIYPLICLTFSLLLAAGLPQSTTATEPGPDKDPTGDAGALKGKVETGCGYDPRTGNASRSITDLHVPGAVGENGLDFTRHWNSLQAQPEIPMSTPFGPAGWTHSWNWSVYYNEEIIDSGPGLQSFQISLTITFPDGRETKYHIDRGLGYGQPTPHWGPPYSPQEATWTAGGTVSDHLCGMQADGKKFWLYLGMAARFVSKSRRHCPGCLRRWWGIERPECSIAMASKPIFFTTLWGILSASPNPVGVRS